MTLVSFNKVTIKRFTIRHYQDNGQTVATVEWSDGKSFTQGDPKNTHMQALWDRAIAENAPIIVEGFPQTIVA